MRIPISSHSFGLATTTARTGSTLARTRRTPEQRMLDLYRAVKRLREKEEALLSFMAGRRGWTSRPVVETKTQSISARSAANKRHFCRVASGI